MHSACDAKVNTVLSPQPGAPPAPLALQTISWGAGLMSLTSQALPCCNVSVQAPLTYSSDCTPLAGSGVSGGFTCAMFVCAELLAEAASCAPMNTLPPAPTANRRATGAMTCRFLCLGRVAMPSLPLVY